MNDSPVGLAAYLLEKFSSWTDLRNRDLVDGGLERYKREFYFALLFLAKKNIWIQQGVCDCCCLHLNRKFSLDDLLTNVMIYWTTGSIVSSMRFYKENFKSNPDNRVDAKYVAKCLYCQNYDDFCVTDLTTLLSYHVRTLIKFPLLF